MIRKTSGGAYVKFSTLAKGQHFKFHPKWGIARVAKKITGKCYVMASRVSMADRTSPIRFCVTGGSVLVQPTGRLSPVKRRWGRNRYSTKLSGLTRRRRRR